MPGTFTSETGLPTAVSLGMLVQPLAKASSFIHQRKYGSENVIRN